MWSSAEVFSDLFPCCSCCGATFDTKHHAPYILSCNHTLCCNCLRNNVTKRKKECRLCKKKFSTCVINKSLIDTIASVNQRKNLLESMSYRCDECDSRRPGSALRRCLTCERAISQHVAQDFFLPCVVCLECCVEKHNGHELVGCNQKRTVVPDTPIYESSSIVSGFGCDTLSSVSGDKLSVSTPTSSSTFSFPTSRTSSSEAAKSLDHSMKSRSRDSAMICEESPVYQSLPSLPVRKLSNGWMGRLTSSFSKRWNSSSEPIKTCKSKTSKSSYENEEEIINALAAVSLKRKEAEDKRIETAMVNKMNYENLTNIDCSNTSSSSRVYDYIRS